MAVSISNYFKTFKMPVVNLQSDPVGSSRTVTGRDRQLTGDLILRLIMGLTAKQSSVCLGCEEIGEM